MATVSGIQAPESNDIRESITLYRFAQVIGFATEHVSQNAIIDHYHIIEGLFFKQKTQHSDQEQFKFFNC